MSGARGKVFIVEDAAETAELLAVILENEGFATAVRGTAREAMAALEAERPTAVFLDWVLPDSSGIEVCRWLRARDGTVPILFVSGRDDEASVTRGLDAGADDFIVKPFRHTELVARLEAHLRKAMAVLGHSGAAAVQVSPAPSEGEVGPGSPGATELQLGEVSIDLAARLVEVDGSPVSLGSLEFQLLAYLCRHPGVAVSRDQVLNEVYGFSSPISTERVDLLVRRLRAKLGPGPQRGGQITAVPGYGYRLERRRGGGPPPGVERRTVDTP